MPKQGQLRKPVETKIDPSSIGGILVDQSVPLFEEDERLTKLKYFVVHEAPEVKKALRKAMDLALQARIDIDSPEWKQYCADVGKKQKLGLHGSSRSDFRSRNSSGSKKKDYHHSRVSSSSSSSPSYSSSDYKWENRRRTKSGSRRSHY